MKIISKLADIFLNTGERSDMNIQFDEMYSILKKLYIFAKNFAIGKTVLDMGCGSGQGIEYLSKVAALAYGVDVSGYAIKKCQQLRQRGNLHYVWTKEKEKLNLSSNYFDLVTSFQVIEHVKEVENWVKEIKRVLKSEGIFILSTPNKDFFSPERETPYYPFHVKEYTANELKDLLEKHFDDVEILFHVEKLRDEEDAKKLEVYNKSVGIKIVYFLSGLNIVRMISRLTPLFLKNIFLQITRIGPPNVLVSLADIDIVKTQTDKAHHLMAICKDRK